VLAGCAPAPGGVAAGPQGRPVQTIERNRPAKGGDVTAGGGTLESVRRQLEGTWQLMSLQVVGANGAATTVPATGKITYDAYGNFDLDIDVKDPAALAALGAQSASIDLKGRAVIDVAKSSLRVQGAEAAPGTSAPENIERVRFYELQGDTLTLTAKDATGKVTGVTSWKRAS
jgi:hypothetical protein